MSYCRWSCLNGYSDVYVYESNEGFVTHVAGNRPPPGAPEKGIHLLLEDQGGSAEKYLAAQKTYDEWSEKNPNIKISHPESGAHFVHETPEECADNLERLQAEGFIVPDYAIAELRADSTSQITTPDNMEG